MDAEAGWLARAGRDLARLAVPVQCAGCGARDVRLCEGCAAPWWEEPLRSESSAPRLAIAGAAALPVWAVASLDGPTHAAVTAWKDGGRRDLDRFFADAAARAAACVAPALGGLGPVAVVPVPSRRASIAKRGANLPLLLASASARALRDAGVDARVRPVLAIGRGEQRGSSARERLRQASSVRARPGTPVGEAAGGAALLVDDVLTTGATLAAASRAVQVRFLTACAALCLAATPGAGTRRDVTVA